jgi:hypothetical protein
MSTEKEKAQVEIAIFMEFLRETALPIDSGSIEKRNPPEPDIYCSHAEEGALYFELVEMCDQNIAIAISKDSQEFFRTSDPTSSILRKKLSRAYQITYPVDLLIYTNGRLVTPDNMIIQKIKRQVERPRGQFRRIWLLGRKGVYLIRDSN